MEILGRLIPPLPGQMRLLSPNDAHDHPVLLHKLEGVMGQWCLLGCFNMSDAPHHYTIATVDFAKGGQFLHIFDVWQQQYNRHQVSEQLECMVDAHQVRLLAIRQADDQPAFESESLEQDPPRACPSPLERFDVGDGQGSLRRSCCCRLVARPGSPGPAPLALPR